MNLEQLKKNKGWRVQLVPIASRLDEQGGELPIMDDDWVIEDVSNSEVRISNVRTQHQVTLGADHIHHFTSNPARSRGVIQYGFLILNVQVFVETKGCSVRPNLRPGEPLRLQRDEIVDKWVDFRYPSDSGIQQRLEATGYTVKWCSDDKLSRKTDLEGWEIVVEPDAQGVRSRFRHKDRPYDQTIIKTKTVERERDNRPTNVKPCLECGQPLRLARRGATLADTLWLCANESCPSNRRR
jgi:hypothetical protein